MMALRQYQQATSLAFEQKKNLSALKSSLKAEKALKKLFKGLLRLPSDKKFSGPLSLLPASLPACLPACPPLLSSSFDLSPP
jgi:hypothetical protein